MPRKPAKPSLTQHKLRMPEVLHRQIAEAAAKRGKSANREMLDRLWTSFEVNQTRQVADVVADLEIAWARWGNTFHEVNKQSDLIRASEALAAQVEQLADASEYTSIKKAAARVRAVTRMIDQEAALLLRRARTGGGSDR